MTTTHRSAEHGTFTLSRTYPVPPERVFAAWSSRESKARWFGAPGAPGYELDFRVGGTEIIPPAGPSTRTRPPTGTSCPTSASSTATPWKSTGR
jgi:uncharacterized protein YndB with AHSA1/START domain